MFIDLYGQRIGLNDDRKETVCPHCQAKGGHSSYCCVQLQKAAENVKKQFPILTEARQHCDYQALLYADAWNDVFCVEAVYWRMVSRVIGGILPLACQD